MDTAVQRLLFWTPRFLGILFAAFLSIFALDVFGEGYGFWGTALALIMHLIPTVIVLAAVAIAWRWEMVGGLLFIGLGAWYLKDWPRGHWSNYLVISGPLFLTGVLFLSDWIYRAKHRAAPGIR